MFIIAFLTKVNVGNTVNVVLNAAAVLEIFSDAGCQEAEYSSQIRFTPLSITSISKIRRKCDI